MTGTGEGWGNVERKAGSMSLNQQQANTAEPPSPALSVHPITGQKSCKDQPIKEKAPIQSKIDRVGMYGSVCSVNFFYILYCPQCFQGNFLNLFASIFI